MSEPDYRYGGFIPGPPSYVTLEPDECIVRPTDPSMCVRPDHDHPDGKAIYRHLYFGGEAKTYDDGGPLPVGRTSIHPVALTPLEGELIATPPEPPHDHVIVSHSGYVWLFSDEYDSWLEVDSQYGDTETWERIYQWHRPLTTYKPAKEIR